MDVRTFLRHLLPQEFANEILQTMMVQTPHSSEESVEGSLALVEAAIKQAVRLTKKYSYDNVASIICNKDVVYDLEKLENRLNHIDFETQTLLQADVFEMQVVQDEQVVQNSDHDLLEAVEEERFVAEKQGREHPRDQVPHGSKRTRGSAGSEEQITDEEFGHAKHISKGGIGAGSEEQITDEEFRHAKHILKGGLEQRARLTANHMRQYDAKTNPNRGDLNCLQELKTQWPGIKLRLIPGDGECLYASLHRLNRSVYDLRVIAAAYAKEQLTQEQIFKPGDGESYFAPLDARNKRQYVLNILGVDEHMQSAPWPLPDRYYGEVQLLSAFVHSLIPAIIVVIHANMSQAMTFRMYYKAIDGCAKMLQTTSKSRVKRWMNAVDHQFIMIAYNGFNHFTTFDDVSDKNRDYLNVLASDENENIGLDHYQHESLSNV